MKKALLVLLALSLPAAAQNYPAKPIRLYTQFGPGTPGDVFGRVLGASMSQVMGQSVVVDSRPAGGGVLVAGLTARSDPDGYTLAILTATVPVAGPVLNRSSMPFDPVKDLTPVVSLIESNSVIVVNAALPINSLKELIGYAKANPGKLSYGTTGVGSSHHLSGEQLDMLTGVKMVHIPYKTSPVVDAAAGVLPIAISITPQTLPLIKAGKVRPIAVTTGNRFRLLPDVPTVTETIPEFEPLPAWTGIYGPAGLPQQVIQRIHADAVAALNQPDTQAKIREIGFDPVVSTSQADFLARSKRGIELTERIVKAAKIEVK
jgi:tripartite-type tricarboxylate transporter receptor subunit TctC